MGESLHSWPRKYFPGGWPVALSCPPFLCFHCVLPLLIPIYLFHLSLPLGDQVSFVYMTQEPSTGPAQTVTGRARDQCVSRTWLLLLAECLKTSAYIWLKTFIVSTFASFAIPQGALMLICVLEEGLTMQPRLHHTQDPPTSASWVLE